MCIVIDSNTFSPIFNNDDSDHSNFEPVRKWIEEGGGQIVYGGSKYKGELSKSHQIAQHFKQLNDLNKDKVVKICDNLVDAKETELKKITPNGCGDQHIIAIVIVSGCRLICTNDKRSHEHIKNPSLYPLKKNKCLPKIYSSLEHKKFLNKKYIVDIKNRCS